MGKRCRRSRSFIILLVRFRDNYREQYLSSREIYLGGIFLPILMDIAVIIISAWIIGRWVVKYEPPAKELCFTTPLAVSLSASFFVF